MRSRFHAPDTYHSPAPALGALQRILTGQCDKEFDPVLLLGAVARRLRHIKQFAAALQFLGTMAIGQQTVVANANEATGQNMHEKPPDELTGIKGHGLSSTILPVVFPGEGHLAVFDFEETMVGDGDAMGIAPKIIEHFLRTAKGRLDVDHPFFPLADSNQLLKRRSVREVPEVIVERQFTFVKSTFQSLEKESSK